MNGHIGSLLRAYPIPLRIFHSAGVTNATQAPSAASLAFYDDISLSNLPFTDGFESNSTAAWHQTVAQ